MSLARLTAYFCWLCGRPADLRLGGDPHYEHRYAVHWCSAAHRAEYRWLASL